MKKKKKIFVLSSYLLLFIMGVAGISIQGEAGGMKSDAGITFVKGSTEPKTEPSQPPGNIPPTLSDSSPSVMGHEKPLGGKNLPSTGEKIIQVLPWVGMIMLIIVILFYLSRNRRGEEK